ncbi:MAG: putative P-loop ATPase [Candidatus Saccharibacteria bacterium]|nr:putative P-loop ATPase [Candidatus Saccharibacteria bacterium]
MLRVDRSTPLESFDELFKIYETNDPNSIPFIGKVKEMQMALREVFALENYKSKGVVLSVEGTWGSGKTTYMNLALSELEDESAIFIKYDSLFYGNVSEATSIFIDDIFKKVRESFGVELNEGGIAKNISPKLELGTGLPRLSLDLSKPKRAPTELIKDNLAKKLRKIDGKVVVVIDDLDRVSGGDVVHFLRIVRVLRELPNFIIILPVDKKALEDLLQGSSIANPRKYLEKIIDWSIGIDPEIPTAKTLLTKKVINGSNGIFNESSIEELWRMILLELSLYTLDNDDIRSTGGNIGIGRSDPSSQQYERKAKSLAAGGDSLMRAFIDRTNTDFGASYNLVTKVVNSAAPNIRFFRSYSTLYSGQNFADFLQGLTSPSLSGTERLEDQSQSIMKTQWWRDSDYISSFNGGALAQTYDIAVPNPQNISWEDINVKLNETYITLWTELKNLVETFYPYEGLRYLAPRSINKIVVALNMDALNGLLTNPIDTPDKQMELHIQVRYAVGRALKEL